MAEEFEYQAKLNIDDILKGLVTVDKQTEATAKRIDAHFKKAGKSISGLFIDTSGRVREANGRFSAMGNAAAKGFGAASGGAQSSGVQIGVVAGVVSSLTTSFINLGQQAITALIDIGKQSVQTALEVDTLKARLGGIFDGSQEAADQAFTFIQDKSRELGFDLSELAGAFIPKTESLAQFERVAKIATALARSDPEQGAIGARIALIEALSGSFVSLGKRFEVGKSDIARIKEAFETEGVESAITTIEKVLDEGGRSFEDFNKTATTSFAKLEIAGQQLGGRLGTPIVESLQAAAEKINGFLVENKDDLIVFADTIGRAIADVIDLFSGLDFGGLDVGTLQSIADYIFKIINGLQLAGGQFLALAGTVSGTNDAGDFFYTLLTNLDDALVTLAQILALTNASFKAAQEGIRPYLKSLQALAEFATGDIPSGIVAITEALNSTTDLAAGQDAFSKSMLESQKAFADYQSALDGNEDSQAALREELEETANAGTDAADAIQAQAAAARDAEAANADYEEALAKVNEKFADAEEELSEKLEDIEIETARKRFDILEEFANKREDLARENARRLEDIARETEQKIQDASIDLNRAEEEIALKFARQQADLERSQADKRIDIEVDYRRKLKDIRKQFELDAEEAERNRDAVSFLRALRQRNEEVSQAQVERQQAINDAKLEGERKREELRISQEQELEDARIANEQKLEDIRLFNQRAIEENATRLNREYEDLAIGEARKLEELELNRQRDIEDANKAYERKIADLEESLKAELELIKAYEQAKRDEYALTQAATESSAGGTGPSTTAGESAGFGSNPGTIGNGSAPSTTGGASAGLGSTPDQFASGGVVPGGRGQPRLIIAHGGEMVIPANSPLLMPVGGSGGGNSYTFNNQKSASLGGLLDPGSLDALLTSKIENVLLNVLNKVS